MFYNWPPDAAAPMIAVLLLMVYATGPDEWWDSLALLGYFVAAGFVVALAPLWLGPVVVVVALAAAAVAAMSRADYVESTAARRRGGLP